MNTLKPAMSRDEFCALLPPQPQVAVTPNAAAVTANVTAVTPNVTQASITVAVEVRLAQDALRLGKCGQLEILIDEIADKHPGLPLRELAAKLPPREGTRLLALIDELELWSRETEPCEVKP